MKSTAIVIVNYRTADLVSACLRSLEAELPALGPEGCVRVVDNASQDGSAEKLAAFIAGSGFGAWAQLIASPRNGGFSAGNNLALRPLLNEKKHAAILLLNPDTYVRPGSIAKLVSFLARDPAVGIVGSRIEDPDGKPQRSAFRFPTPLSELERAIDLGPVTRLLERWAISYPPAEVAHRCAWVAGASMLIRREVFESIGLFDEDYFLYFEEVDFCLRAARAGFECWYDPSSRIVHYVGASTGVTDLKKQRARRPRYWFDSRRRFLVKNHGTLVAAVCDLAFLAGRLAGAPGRLVRGKPEALPERFVGDFVRQSVFLKGFRP